MYLKNIIGQFNFLFISLIYQDLSPNNPAFFREVSVRLPFLLLINQRANS